MSINYDEVNRLQRKISESSEKYICVNATAGSGKTKTLIDRAARHSKITNKKILIISFTKSVVKEVKGRIKRLDKNIDNIEVKTFDSLFIDIFLNYQHLVTNKNLSRKKLKFYQVPPKGEDTFINYESLLYDENLFYFTSNWFKKCTNKLLKDSGAVSDWIKNKLESKYYEILVDEFQDMDKHQLWFIDLMSKTSTMRISLFGDVNQSIFKFRNAVPMETISFIKNNGFKLMPLNISIRCPNEIYRFASTLMKYDDNLEENDILNYDQICSHLETKVKNKLEFEFDDIDEDFLIDKFGVSFSESSNAILVSNHKIANNLIKNKGLNKFKNSQSPFMNIYDSGYEWEEICRVYFNKDIKTILSLIPIEDDFAMNRDYVKELYPKYINNLDKDEGNFRGYLSYFTSHFLGANISDIQVTIDTLVSKRNEIKKWVQQNNNVILTTFSAKGNEYDNVIIVFEREPWKNIKNDTEIMEKFFVAMTRTKNKLGIAFK